MNKKVIIAFLGNAKFDARCINMADSLLDHGYKVILIDELAVGESGLKSNRFKIFHTRARYKSGIARYWGFYRKVKKLNDEVKPMFLLHQIYFHWVFYLG